MLKNISRASILSILIQLTLALGVMNLQASEGGRSYSRGRELLSEGRYQEAAPLLEEAIAKSPDNVMAMYYLGLAYSKNVLTFNRAEELFLDIPVASVSIDSKPRNDILFLSGLALGKLYIKSGNYEEAISLIRNTIASAPPGSALDDAHCALGLALYFERLYDEAIFEFRKAIKFNPDNMEARFNLKTIRARLEHYEAGKIYSRMGERKEAISQFREAIRLDPRFIEARVRLGVEYMEYGDSYTSLRELVRAESISESYGKFHEIWYAEGLALLRMMRRSEAMDKFLKAIESDPRFAPAHNQAGLVLMKKGEYEDAIKYFVTAIGIDPRTEYVRNMLVAISRKGK